jgi:5-methylcytosine-specific restriction protein A
MRRDPGHRTKSNSRDSCVHSLPSPTTSIYTELSATTSIAVVVDVSGRYVVVDAVPRSQDLMPTIPPARCSWPQGCPNRRARPTARYCATHESTAEAEQEHHRGTPAQRGYNYRWRQYALAYLREHPLCVACQRQGRATAATDVDHIRPAKGQRDPRFWDVANHQALCHSCHSRKTAQTDGRWG